MGDVIDVDFQRRTKIPIPRFEVKNKTTPESQRFYDKGIKLMESERFDDARDTFEQALVEDASNVAAWIEYSNCSVALRDYEGAESALLIAHRLTENGEMHATIVRYNLGWLKYEIGRNWEAKAWFQRTIEVRDGDDLNDVQIDALHNLAIVCNELRQYETAVEWKRQYDRYRGKNEGT